MRFLFALFALPLLIAATPARDWTRATTRLASGQYLLGKPTARVKLIEYASYTCPHCAHFAGESAPVLHDLWIRQGAVSLELRHLIRDSADLAAAIVARCTGPKFFATSYAIFARQNEWIERAIAYQQNNAARLDLFPAPARLRAIADGAGLSDIGRSQGLTDARLDACFGDQPAIDRIVAASAAATDINSTPTFVLDGKKIEGVGWDKLEPMLRARGLK